MHRVCWLWGWLLHMQITACFAWQEPYERVRSTYFNADSLYIPNQPPLHPCQWILADMYTHTHTQTVTNSLHIGSQLAFLIHFPLKHMRAQFSETSTRSLCLSMGEPSLSRKSASVWPQCAFFPELNRAADTSAAGGDTAVRDMPHYSCCKCQSTKVITHSSTGCMVICSSNLFSGKRG